MDKIKKLKQQKNIGIILAITGVLSLVLLSFLIGILILAIGFWLTYKAENDIKKM